MKKLRHREVMSPAGKTKKRTHTQACLTPEVILLAAIFCYYGLGAHSFCDLEQVF
jgi:hypothetical protein